MGKPIPLEERGGKTERENRILEEHHMKLLPSGKLIPDHLEPARKGHKLSRAVPLDRKLISSAYKMVLSDPVPEQFRRFKVSIGKNEAVIDLGKHAIWADLIAYGQAVSAVNGSTPASEAMADRTEGKVPQAVSQDGPMEIRITHEVLGAVAVGVKEMR